MAGTDNSLAADDGVGCAELHLKVKHFKVINYTARNL